MINNDWIFYFSNYTTATSDMSACCTAGPTVHWHDNELPIESNYNWIADLQYYDVQFLSTFAIKQVANSTVLQRRGRSIPQFAMYKQRISSERLIMDWAHTYSVSAL